MPVNANDKIQIATIGFGGMGQADTKSATAQPGVQLVSVCDLYEGRLEHAKEVYGDQVRTTRDYREVLDRKDIDAVIIATPDHWHSRITVDALKAGKDVYCEKPMVHTVEEGATVVQAEKQSGRILQIGSQYVSSAAYIKAKQLTASGAIGELNMVEAWLDRSSAIGAWQYSIPTDASPQTVDWDRFLGSAPKRPYDATRFFRWRNYQDYGTGVAGDLFVHLLSGLHLVTGSLGPERIFSMGGLRHWKDGRDVPDVMLATMDYPKTEQHPAFNFALRVNFAGSGATDAFGFRFIGTEGILVTSMREVTLMKEPRGAEPDYSVGAFPAAMQPELSKRYYARMKAEHLGVQGPQTSSDEKFVSATDAHLEHHRVFFESVRSRKPVTEDASFGMRAAGPALLANTSYFEQRVCHWDPIAMRTKAG